MFIDRWIQVWRLKGLTVTFTLSKHTKLCKSMFLDEQVWWPAVKTDVVWNQSVFVHIFYKVWVSLRRPRCLFKLWFNWWGSESPPLTDAPLCMNQTSTHLKLGDRSVLLPAHLFSFLVFNLYFFVPQMMFLFIRCICFVLRVLLWTQFPNQTEGQHSSR